MFMGVTFITINEEGIIDQELRAVVNTNSIQRILENSKYPNTTVIFFNDDTPTGLIKGSYEQNAKILLGFNRKL